MEMEKRMTNAKFAETDKSFRAACKRVIIDKANNTSLPPTTRQASKWRRGKGLAWNEGRK